VRGRGGHPIVSPAFWRVKETIVTPLHPGNEPDADDMAISPDEGVDPAAAPDLPEEEAEALGDFA
jgi:hypothetical protein